MLGLDPSIHAASAARVAWILGSVAEDNGDRSEGPARKRGLSHMSKRLPSLQTSDGMPLISPQIFPMQRYFISR